MADPGLNGAGGGAQPLSQGAPVPLSPLLVPTAVVQANTHDPIPPATGIFTAADQQVIDTVGSPIEPIAQQRKQLVNNQTTPLFTVDMSKIPDNSYAAHMIYALESTDGVNTQMRSGLIIMNIARTPGTNTYTTNSAAFDIASVTSGTLTMLANWATAGNIATFRMNPASSLVPTDLHVTFYFIFLSHPAANALALA